MKYNPLYHSNIIRNYRNKYLETFGEKLNLTDIEIWEIYDEFAEHNDTDQVVLDELYSRTN